MARRAQGCKEILSKSTVQKLKSEMTPHISRATIRGLAAGLGVTPLTVGTAALESWGINTRPVEVTDSVATIEIDPSLSVSNRRELIALIKEMRSPASVHDTESRSAAEITATVASAVAPFEAEVHHADHRREQGG